MHKIAFVLCCFLLVSCEHKKPELTLSQIVNGKSIVVPPECDIIPESAAAEE